MQSYEVQVIETKKVGSEVIDNLFNSGGSVRGAVFEGERGDSPRKLHDSLQM